MNVISAGMAFPWSPERSRKYTRAVSLALILIVGWTAPSTAAIFVVDTTSDAFLATCGVPVGDCSLRGALESTNSSPGTDNIYFDIPGAGPHTFQPATALPTLNGPVIIDGTTEPDFAGTPIIELDGSGAGVANGLNVFGGSSTVRGLVINGFGGDGIQILGPGGNLIAGNYIGTDVSGTVAIPNGEGVVIGNDGNTVGGETPALRNLISGNTGAGVKIFTNNNVVKGNYLGTDVTGTVTLGNQYGVWLINNAVGNTIGGTTVGARNIISGNDQIGLFIFAAGTSSNIVMGNFIGTDVAGTGTLSNGFGGILISANSHDNVVGGVGPGQSNIIAFNTHDGVCVISDSSLGNSIRGNSIYSNGQLGINLATSAEGACPGGAVTANDAGDGDIGPNGLMNFPVITFSSFDGINTTVSGTLDTIDPGTSAVDVYATDLPDVSGNGESRAYLGSTTAPAGSWTLVISGSLPLPHLTTTATDAGGNTSEFSLTLTDLDGDGIADIFETNTGVYVSPTDTGTDPNDADSDDDGLEDGAETALGTDPNEPDHDSDGVCDGAGLGGGACTAGPDNCPLAANPAPQADSGGIDTTTPDGIGDVCQCGDATNNGIVDAADIQVARENLVGATLSDAFIGKRCNVIGLRAGDASGSDCDVEDVYLLRRAIAGEAVLIENTCDAYFGL